MTAQFATLTIAIKRHALPLALLSAMAATPALAFVLTSVVNPADVLTDHPYRILGLAPGASYEEIAAAASERSIPLYPQEGVMTVTSGGTKIGLNVTYGFQTHGYDNPYLYQNGKRSQEGTGSSA